MAEIEVETTIIAADCTRVRFLGAVKGLLCTPIGLAEWADEPKQTGRRMKRVKRTR